jgi:hypothetical protein
VAAYDTAMEAWAADTSQPQPEPPDEPVIRPWQGDPVWCPPCKARIRDCLTGIDELASLLNATADGLGSGGSSEQMQHAKVTHPPSPSPAMDTEDEITDYLAEWEHLYRREKGYDPAPPRGELASRTTLTVAWLNRHLDGILASSVAEGFGDDVIRYHAELRARAKAGRRKLDKPLRCPACRHLLLRYVDGEPYVECRNPACNALLTYAEYDAAVDAMAASISRGEVTRENAQDDAMVQT